MYYTLKLICAWIIGLAFVICIGFLIHFNAIYERTQRDQTRAYRQSVCEVHGGTFLPDVYYDYIHHTYSSDGDWCIGD